MIIIGVVIVTISFLIPLGGFIEFPSIQSRLNFEIGIRFCLLIFPVFVLAKSPTLLHFNGMNNILSFSNLHTIILPFLICLLGLVINYSVFANLTVGLLSTLILFKAIIGISEEILFRGIILPLLVRLTNKVFTSIILSSTIFGALHALILIKHPESLDHVLSQVIFATSGGMFLAAILLRTKNLLVPIILHSSFDLIFGSTMLIKAFETGVLQPPIVPNSSVEDANITGIAIILILICFSLVATYKSRPSKIVSMLTRKAQ